MMFQLVTFKFNINNATMVPCLLDLMYNWQYKR